MTKAFGRTVCVPTKAILFGEHLALRGYDALAIPLRNYLFELHGTYEPGELKIEVPYGFRVEDVLKVLRPTEGHYTFSVEAPFPPGSGAGISAAWAVALTRFAELENGLALVDELEKNAHGRASGLDARTIFYDRPVALRKNQFEILDESILELPLVRQLEFLASGIPVESTREMIEHVEKSSAWGEIGDLPDVNDMLRILHENRESDLKKSLNVYGEILEKLGAVSPQLVAEFRVLRTQGHGVKISGAGGFSKGSGLTIFLK